MGSRKKYEQFKRQLMASERDSDLVKYLAQNARQSRKGNGQSISALQSIMMQRDENENAYLNERQALEKAGLNSALLYQNGSNGGLTANTDAFGDTEDQYGQGMEMFSQLFGQVSQLAQLGMQAQDLKSQIDVRQAQIDNINANTSLQSSQRVSQEQQNQYFNDVRAYRERVEKNTADVSDLQVIYQGFVNGIASNNVNKSRIEVDLLKIQKTINEMTQDDQIKLRKIQTSTSHVMLMLSALEFLKGHKEYSYMDEKISSEINKLKSEAAKNYAEAKNLNVKTSYLPMEHFVSYIMGCNSLLGTIGDSQKILSELEAGFKKFGFEGHVGVQMAQNALSGITDLQDNIFNSIYDVWGDSGLYWTKTTRSGAHGNGLGAKDQSTEQSVDGHVQTSWSVNDLSGNIRNYDGTSTD